MKRRDFLKSALTVAAFAPFIRGEADLDCGKFNAYLGG